MLTQFDSTYRLTVYTSQETVIVEFPITCKFTVTRTTLSDTNKATIQLYGLGSETRNKIFQDQYYNFYDDTKHKYVLLEAGYNENAMTQIFLGRILQAYSYKQGQNDVVTEIEAMAMDLFARHSSHTFAAGTTYKDAVKTIVSSNMPNVTLGDLGSLNGVFQTPTTFDGNAKDQIEKISGGHAFIDNGVLNILMSNEVRSTPVPVISKQTNLLGTPMRRDANLEIKTTFYPDLVVGQLVEIDSAISPNFNGQFKLVGFTHDCLISKSVAGQRTTQMTLWIGPMLPSSNIALTDNKGQGFVIVSGDKIEPVNIKEPSAARDVYNYLQKNNGKMPNSYVTKSIKWSDMIGQDNTDAERKSECTIGILSNVYNTAQTMQKVIDGAFRGRKVVVTSGWRSVRNNRACGGKPTSKHLKGLAIDIKIQGVSPSAFTNYLRTVWNGWVGEYPTFTHAQLNPSKGRANDV